MLAADLPAPLPGHVRLYRLAAAANWRKGPWTASLGWRCGPPDRLRPVLDALGTGSVPCWHDEIRSGRALPDGHRHGRARVWHDVSDDYEDLYAAPSILALRTWFGRGPLPPSSYAEPALVYVIDVPAGEVALSPLLLQATFPPGAATIRAALPPEVFL